MNYTDKILLRASQVAYFLIDESVLNDINDWYEFEKIPEENRTYTLSELYAHSEIFKKEIYKKIKNVSELNEDIEVFINLDKATVLSRIESPSIRERVAEMYDIIDDIVNDRYGIGSWKVRSFVWNDVTGMEGHAGNFINGEWVINNFSSSGDILTICNFNSERFTFEFADGISRYYDTEIGEFKKFEAEQGSPVDELPKQNNDNAEKTNAVDLGSTSENLPDTGIVNNEEASISNTPTDTSAENNEQIKLEAYPYNKYGTVKGTVKYISPSLFANKQLGNLYCFYQRRSRCQQSQAIGGN